MALVIINDRITFSKSVFRGNGIRENYSLDAFITKHGFFIPLHMHSFCYLDYLDGTTKRLPPSPKLRAALLITPDSKVYEFTSDNRAVMQRRLGYPGISFITRDEDTNSQESMIASYDIALESGVTPDGEALLRQMAETTTYYKREYVSYDIAELVEMVNKKFPK